MSNDLRICNMRSKSSAIQVLVADKHPLFRAGIRQELEQYPDIEVIAEAANGSEVLEQVESYQPTVLILDLNLRQISGLEVMIRLNEMKNKTKNETKKIPYVLVLSSYCDCHHVTSMMNAGAMGYLTKWEEAGSIVEGIRKVASGLRALSQEVLDKWQPMLSAQIIDLTTRELEVLKLVAHGHSNISIANLLMITVGTVKV